VTLKASTTKKQPKRALTPWIVGPDARMVEDAKLSGGNGKTKGSVAVCPATGRYFAIFASSEGDATRLAASVAVTPPKALKGSMTTLGSRGPRTLAIGARAGGCLDLRLKADKRSDLVVLLRSVTDPAGQAVPLDGLVTEKNGALRFVAVLPTAGTWLVTVAAKPGTDGTVSWSYRIKQPRGQAYSIAKEDDR
jgi:hypothetical protein